MVESQAPDRLINIEALLSPIEGENPSGRPLRYERIYDEIREARREDDDSLSYGIWQHELKRADWKRVESLCLDALQHQTKDLQIAGWLAEAWTISEGIEGLAHGLQLITGLTEKFWETIYPAFASDDLEYRSQFYSWLDTTLAARLVKLVFAPDEFGEGVTLASWLAAQRFDSVLKRAPDAERLARKAEERGQITFEQCQTILSMVSTAYGEAYLKNLLSAEASLIALKKTLDAQFPDNTVAFEGLTSNFQELIRIYKAEISNRPVPESTTAAEAQTASPEQRSVGEEGQGISLHKESSISTTPLSEISPQNQAAFAAEIQVQTREQAYEQLSKIAALLQTLEPHSPASHLLHRVILWQNKSMIDILNEMGSSPEDIMALMKFLGIGTTRAAPTMTAEGIR
ncbi:type VI secretion system protein TssA [Candidatus Odyssella thessalonicensis]|uniref:type VI secretion system protein TssA n=1 Tax=Candidatus Odyssella thessalonicensis TaxID=84647 RepID=UPI000225BC5B|nr:type VI secretion system protein TssA [Candidatus Odyssella thessalonicensis]